jgi:hypothetical protein
VKFQGFHADVVDNAVAMLSVAIRPVGGGTFIDGGQSTTVPTGFIVGGNPAQKTLVIDAQWPDAQWGDRHDGLSSAAVDALAGWLTRLPIMGNGSLTIGVWRDQEGDNRIYVDVVDSLSILADALALAKERGEIAIYDALAGISIKVDG